MERMPPEDLVFARTILSEVRPAVTAQVFEHIAALEAQANADAYALYGYTVFTGPCVHGRDPWDRCDECGEETAIHALIKVRATLEKALEDVRKERDDGAHRLKEWEASFNRISHELVTAQQELARLKPSGDVAEDEEALRKLLEEMRSHMLFDGWREAMALHLPRLKRLAAKAQGYEASELERARLAAENERLTSLIMATRAECDAAVNAAKEWERLRNEAYRLYREAGEKLDAAMADNAALVEFCRTERQMLALLYHRIKALGVHDATDAMTDAMTTVECWMDVMPDTYERPHPGAALLEQHHKEVAQARNEGLEEAAVFVRAECGPDAAQAIRSMKTPTPELWPTAEYAKRTVRELVKLLEPFAAGEEGNKDVVGRVKRLMERSQLLDELAHGAVVTRRTDGSCAKCRSGEPCH